MIIERKTAYRMKSGETEILIMREFGGVWDVYYRRSIYPYTYAYGLPVKDFTLRGAMSLAEALIGKPECECLFEEDESDDDRG